MSLFFSYNLPLQLWPFSEDGIDKTTLLVYMPRRESVAHLNLSDVIGDLTREEFLEQTALRLENLARLFRKAKEDKELTIYYPDEGMEG